MIGYLNKKIGSGRYKAAMHKWTGDWGGRAFIGFSLFVAIYVLNLFFHWGGEEHKSLLSNIATLVIYSGPALFALRASSQTGIPARARWAWRFISLAHISFIAGTGAWTYFENIMGEQPFPSWADAGYLLFYPCMLAGLLLLTEKMRSSEERLKFFLDGGVVMLGGGIVLWHFLLAPIAQADDGDTLKTVLSLAYPIGDLVLLLGISSLLLRGTAVRGRSLVNLLLIGVSVNFLADFAFGYQSLAGTYESGNPVDAFFALTTIPVMLAAHLHYVIPPVAEHANNYERLSRFFWVPYLAVGVVYIVLLHAAIDNEVDILPIAVMVAGIVTALVIFRQFMFVRENARAYIALTEVQERIHGIYSASTDAIALADFSGTILEVNDSFVRLTGQGRDEIVGVMSFYHFVPESYLELSVTPDIAVANGRPVEYEREIVRPDGSTRNVTTTLYAVNGADGTPAAMAVVVRDITDRRLLEQQLTHQALHDPLTGLANRALLSEQVTAARSRSRRRNTNIAVLFMDLDNFKVVNDTLGHAAGDTLLVTVAKRIKGCLRTSDTAARLGGDEFAILLEDITDQDEHLSVADRIMTAVRTPILINGTEASVGASIGIALSSNSVDSPEDLLRNADVAMYRSKKDGKNRYTVYEDAMHAAVIHRSRIEAELRSAIMNKELAVHYQPIIDLSTRRVVAMEALLRWDHPRKIDIGPAEFIPIAEEADLIRELGGFVLDKAITQAAVWKKTHLSGQPFAMSVNISGRQFMDSGFVDTVADSCHESGYPPNDLILEITESTMLINTGTTVRKLEEIRDLGVKLAIDDFGTGYSSLSYLNKFPIDILKIDRSFIEDINSGAEGAAMAKAIISMSQTLHFTTIAEGVETAGQVRMLCELGCTWGQGYLISKPLTVGEMDRFLKKTTIHARKPARGENLAIIGAARHLRQATS